MTPPAGHDIREVQRTLGRIEGTLGCIQQGQTELRESMHGIEGRLRAIEIRSTTVASVIAAGCAGLAHTLGIGAGPS